MQGVQFQLPNCMLAFARFQLLLSIQTLVATVCFLLFPGLLGFSFDTSLFLAHEDSHYCCLRLGPTRSLCFWFGYALRFICLPLSTSILCNRKAQTLYRSVCHSLCCLTWFPPCVPAYLEFSRPCFSTPWCSAHTAFQTVCVPVFCLAKIQPSCWYPPLSHLDLFSCKWSSSLLLL